MVSSTSKPAVLILGSTGQLGQIIADRLQKNNAIALTVTSRKPEQLPKLKEKYGHAVYLDLNDRDDLPQLIGRKGMTLKEWAKLHKNELIKLGANAIPQIYQ